MYTDPKETRKIEYSKKNGDQEFTLLAIAKMSENKVNGPEDAVVKEIIKKLHLENVNTTTKYSKERFTGKMEPPSSWKIVKLVFLRKPDAETKKVISYRAIAMTSVMSKWHASCAALCLE